MRAKTEQPRRFVRMFQPQFAAAVKSGTKHQTIRKTPKRMPKPGDWLSCREWLGAPYRSRQNVLFEALITSVLPVKILPGVIEVNGRWLSGDEEWEFARADGFNSPQRLVNWFIFNHGLPFEGVVIKWDFGADISGNR